tara:strand:+ start:214 stop:390 length:177 start_codon:yes stop_codon:yes gene_type:complete
MSKAIQIYRDLITKYLSFVEFAEGYPSKEKLYRRTSQCVDEFVPHPLEIIVREAFCPY